MTRKEINEIKSQFNIEDCGILKLCGCYVDGEKNKVTTINETFLNLPEEERHKYIDIFILTDTIKRLRCFSIDTDEMKSSIVNITIIKIMGENKNYYAIFSYNNINFDIETTGISEEEFIRLIKSIIK